MKKKYILREKIAVSSVENKNEQVLGSMVDRLSSSLPRGRGQRISRRKVITCLIESVQNIYQYSSTSYADEAVVEVSSTVFGVINILTNNLVEIKSKERIENILRKIQYKNKDQLRQLYDESLFSDKKASDTNNGLGLISIVVNVDSFQYDFTEVTKDVYMFALSLDFKS